MTEKPHSEATASIEARSSPIEFKPERRAERPAPVSAWKLRLEADLEHDPEAERRRAMFDPSAFPRTGGKDGDHLPGTPGTQSRCTYRGEIKG